MGVIATVKVGLTALVEVTVGIALAASVDVTAGSGVSVTEPLVGADVAVAGTVVGWG